MLTTEQIIAAMAHLTPEEREKLERLKSGIRPAFCDPAFPEQTAFIRDQNRFKVAFCTRRAGKSLGSVDWLIDGAHDSPGSDSLFLGLTRESTRRAAWKNGVKLSDKRFRLGGRFNETELSYALKNGSSITLLGMDADPKQMDKVLGGKLKRVVIDEAGSFNIDLTALIFEKLKPALADLRGEIALIGTPTNLKRGPFYELTKGQNASIPGRWLKDGWSCHRWSALQNPYMQAQWEEDIAQLKAQTPNIEEVPWFIQQYLGRWVIDTSKLVYRYLEGRNDFRELPRFVGDRGRWHYVLAVDLGYDPDPSSFTVCAYHDFDPTLYILESDKETRLDVTDVANRTKAMRIRYDFDAMVVDNANKQAVEELKRRHDLPFVAADKTGKADFIEIMNAEFIKGKIKLDPERCAPLAEEYSGLIWDDRSARREEHPKCANHCTDGALYGWRKCYQYLSEIQVPPPKTGTPEWMAKEVERMRAEEEEELRRQKEEEQELVGVGSSMDWEESLW
jgi:hypothetical protein